MLAALDKMATLLAGHDADAWGCPWHALQPEHTALLRAKLAEQLAAASVNKHIAALRGVLRAAWRLGLLDAEAYQRAADVPPVRGSRLPAGRSVTPGELHALLRACADDHTPAGARDAAIIALLYSCGLRRAEVVALDLADYDAEAGTLRVRGKGGKERLAHVVNGTADALHDWLAVRGDRPGALFCQIRRGGHLTWRRLTTTGVYVILRDRAQQAGVKPLTPHDLRRTFVGDLLDNGADLATVQQLAGHASPTTTARYDRRGDAARRKAVTALHVPYTRQKGWPQDVGGAREL